MLENPSRVELRRFSTGRADVQIQREKARKTTSPLGLQRNSERVQVQGVPQAHILITFRKNEAKEKKSNNKTTISVPLVVVKQ